MFFWHDLSFTLFYLSVPLEVVLALVRLVITKEKLELLLSFVSNVKLLKFIFFVLER